MAKDIKKEEKQAEKEAEAEAKVETPVQEAAGPVDEEAQKAAAVEKEAGTAQQVPAEVAAINTDTETAKSVNSQQITDNKKKEKPAPSGKFKEIIKQIEELKVADLVELVKELEERFGVSAMPMPMAGAPAASAEATGVEEKSTYTVVLTDSGAQKIAVIKAVREIKPDLGLKEAKDLVDAPPKELLKDVKKVAADEAKKKIEAAGGKVELK